MNFAEEFLRYPWIAKVLTKVDDPAMPYGNVIMNNLSCGKKFLNLHSELNFSIAKVSNNVIADNLICNWRNVVQEQSRGEVMYKNGDPNMTAKLQSYGNIFLDPNSVPDLKSNGFVLPKDHPALKMDFKQIPFDQIGIQKTFAQHNENVTQKY